jgi:pilus assembly protein CpaB
MPKTFRIIALSLVGLAVLLAIIALGIGKRASAPGDTSTPVQNSANQAPRITMVVAAKALSAGKPVVLGDLKTVDVDVLPPGHFSTPYQAAGALPARDIAADTALSAEHFLRGLSSHLQHGERAIAVAVDEISGVGNRVEPGDFVDVFVSLPETGIRGEGAREPPLTRMIASRLRVLSYGQSSVIAEQPIQPSAPTAADTTAAGHADERAMAITARSNQEPQGNSSRNLASSAVLAVPPDQAGTLLLGAQEGKLFLALRHPADLAVVDRELFPGHSTVLPIGSRAGLEMTEISAEERAYAGVQLSTLTGAGRPVAVRQVRAPAVPAAAPRRRAAAVHHPVQIVRGSDSPRPLASY